jgi:Icc-related predicted phosphoesterase
MQLARDDAAPRGLVLLAAAGLAVAGVLFVTTLSDEVVSQANEDAELAPRGVHLSFTEDTSTTMTVTWFTDGGEDPGTVAQWAPTCDDLADPDTRSSTTGSAEPLTLAPDTTVHEATMTGFEPGESFAYRVGSAAGGFSSCWETSTIPEEGPVDVALYGDQGLTPNAEDVRDQVLEEDPDLVLIAGDLSYAEGDPEVWDEWFEVHEELHTETPIMTAPGNHETYADTDPATLPYEERLAQPGEEIYYSFDVANMHFLVLHSDLGDAREQGVYLDMLEFAERDLEQAHAAKEAGETDHIFLLQHHPFYSNTQSVTRWVEPEHTVVQEQWLHRYDVAMLLTGHNHNYERTYPVAYQAPTDTSEGPYEDPIGWIQVISGGAGRGLYDIKHPDDQLPYSATVEFAHHHTNLRVDGGEVEVEAVQAQFPAGQVLDAFTYRDTGEDTPVPTHEDARADDLPP